MYEVHTTSPLDEQWEERDAIIKAAAGTPSRPAETSGKTRLFFWLVPTLEQARQLKELLSSIDGVNATIREH